MVGERGKGGRDGVEGEERGGEGYKVKLEELEDNLEESKGNIVIN